MRLLIIIPILFAVIIPSAFAFSFYSNSVNVVSIQLSQGCMTMLKNNITTSCPSYEDLYNLGWDDSLPGTGKFYYDDNGFFQRGKPEYKNVYELYKYEDYHILIDPPSNIALRSKVIVISPDLPVYIPIGEYKKVDHTRKIASDRYVDPDCREAIITSENWPYLLSDTIYYLRGDCKHTNFDVFEEIQDYISSMDRSTSKQFKYNQWLAETKEKCKGVCKEY